MAADLYRSYVVLHLPLENDLLDTTGKSVTNTGGVSLTSANNPAPYGTKCGQFGADTRLRYADSTDWHLGTGDYTIEFWVKPTAADLSGIHAIINQRSGNGQQWGLWDGRLLHWVNNITHLGYSGVTLAAGTAYHIAFCRAGTALRSFVNGVLDTTLSGYTADLTDQAAVLAVGGDATGYGQHFYGTLKDVRITKGYARYTAAFTPPTEALPLGANISGTIRDAGNYPLAGATVRAYDRATGALLGSTVTAAGGTYTLPAGSGQHYVVALDPAGAANAQIADLVVGV